MSDAWNVLSWQHKHISQNITYPNQELLLDVVKRLNILPGLVSIEKINKLKQLIYSASKGDAFILQGGDCSELFLECTPNQVRSKLEILTQMSLRLNFKKPVIKIGRIAGQYAKPRSNSYETVDGTTLLSYRGDIINGYEFNQDARSPDPNRILHAYSFASKTLQYIKEYNDEIFVSHEALHLSYESALTRCSNNKFYNLSTHFPWIGVRTQGVNSAHVEYLRGIENPVGIKVGPNTDFDELFKTVDIINPDNSSNKIVIIHRFGSKHIANQLPILLNGILDRCINCAVICDPMHGNTYITKSGIKTRYFDDIVDELIMAFEIHHNSTIPFAGIHFEMTSDSVTECIGGACGLMESDLNRAYTSLTDPRLNYEQSMEMASKIAHIYQDFI